MFISVPYQNEFSKTSLHLMSRSIVTSDIFNTRDVSVFFCSYPGKSFDLIIHFKVMILSELATFYITLPSKFVEY